MSESDSWISKELWGVVVFISVVLFGAFAYFHWESRQVEKDLFELAHRRATKSDGTIHVVGSPDSNQPFWRRWFAPPPPPVLTPKPEPPTPPVVQPVFPDRSASMALSGMSRSIVWKKAPRTVRVTPGDRIEIRKGSEGPWFAEVTGVMSEGRQQMWLLRANDPDADAIERLSRGPAKAITVRLADETP